jgi:YD repeat-containing protein
LTGITQGTASIPIAYDNADRRTSLTLPNGILLTYTYDSDSRVTAMIWTLGSTAVGDLEYQYDADNRVIQKTGSFAQTKLPAAVSNNTFNAANEMTAFNGTPQTYDANGNLTNDGTNTYTWDARNHLTAIAGSSSATFAYDPLRRRDQKTINGVSTQFLYDGSNPVHEIQNGAPSDYGGCDGSSSLGRHPSTLCIRHRLLSCSGCTLPERDQGWPPRDSTDVLGLSRVRRHPYHYEGLRSDRSLSSETIRLGVTQRPCYTILPRWNRCSNHSG